MSPVVNRWERYEKFPAWLIDEGVVVKMTKLDLVVYLHLLRMERGHSDGTYARISVERLAERAGSTWQAARLSLRRLLKLGVVHRRNRPQKGVTGEYVIVRTDSSHRGNSSSKTSGKVMFSPSDEGVQGVSGDTP